MLCFRPGVDRDTNPLQPEDLTRSLPPCATQVDVYAFGVMLNEMMGKEVPFGGCGVPEIRAAVLSGQRPDMPLSCPKVGRDQRLFVAFWWVEPDLKRS